MGLISCLQSTWNAPCLAATCSLQFSYHIPSFVLPVVDGWAVQARSLSYQPHAAELKIPQEPGTCVSSSNSLLEPLGDTQRARIHHLQELRGFYSWRLLLGRNGHAVCYLQSLSTKPSTATSVSIRRLQNLFLIKIQTLFFPMIGIALCVLCV